MHGLTAAGLSNVLKNNASACPPLNAGSPSSTGIHNVHSPLAFARLQQMETAVKALVEPAQL